MGSAMNAKTTTETTNTIRGASGAEAAMQQLFQRLAEMSGGQLGDLSALASGNMQGPTAADQALVDKSFGYTAEAARGQIDQEMARMMSQLDEEMRARGLQGSSIESVGRGQVASAGVNRMAELMAQLQNQQGNALMQLPFQRGQMQIGANTALFNQIAGMGSPLLSSGLQERLASMSTKSTSETYDPIGQITAGAQVAFGGGK